MSARLVSPAVLAAVLAGALATSPASAAEPAEPARAATLFREGRTLLSQGRFELACERFAESRAVEPTIGALLNIADCHERAGKLIAARTACLEAHDLAVARQDAERATFAETRAKEIDDHTPRLRIVVTRDDGNALRVTRDGATVDEASFGRAIATDPGPHVILAEAAGREPYRRDLTLTAGETPVTVAIPRLARSGNGAGNGRSVLASSEPPSGRGAASASASRNTTALVLAGAGGAVLVASAVTGGLAFSRWHDALGVCPMQQCATAAAQDEATRTKDQASSFALASTLAFVAGGLLLAGGLYLGLVPRR